MSSIESLNNRPEESQNNENKPELSRREFLKRAGGVVATSFLATSVPFGETSHALAEAESSKMLFTQEEAQEKYKEEYEKGLRLTNFLRKEEEGIIGTADNKEFLVSPNFVEQTLRHMKEMIEQRAAKYLFRLDSYHGHLFLPSDILKETENDSYEQLLHKASGNDKLGTLYHNSEFLTAKNSKTKKINKETEELIKRRNVIGWYDGRPIEILKPAPDGSGVTPEFVKKIGIFHYKAHCNGEFEITIEGKKIRVDISLDAK